MTGKMSLVVLRSWSDGPPKVRAIAPPDDDRSLVIEPDHMGRFLTQEEITQDDPRFNPRQRAASAGAKLSTKRITQKTTKDEDHENEKKVLSNGNSENNGMDKKNGLPLFIRRKIGYLERNNVNRHSYAGIIGGGVCDSNNIMISPTSSSPATIESGGYGCAKFPVVGRSLSTMHLSSGKIPPDNLSIRPGSASSPDHPDGSSLEYTPPSSPVIGRYRNLGPELAATIPKRTIKSSWITGIKSRWMKSTTHPESGRSTLKSYSSSPSLVTASSPPVLKEELVDLGESTSANISEVSPFFNPLYKFTHSNHDHLRNNHHTDHFRPNTTTGSNNSTGSSSGIALSADDDSHSERSRSSLSNPVSSYSPSPPPNPVASLRQQIVYNSSRPNGIQKFNSLTDFSEEDLFSASGSSTTGRSLTGSPYGLPSVEDSHTFSPSASDECVLVEVIRKPETPPKKNDRVKTVIEKRHSVGEVEPVICNKFAGVKVEGSPGKVARIKESIKKFGRFGRNQSEKILRFQPENLENSEENSCKTEFSLNKVRDSEEEEEAFKTIQEQNPSTAPIPTARKRSKASEIIIAPCENSDQSEAVTPKIQTQQPGKKELLDAITSAVAVSSSPTPNYTNKESQSREPDQSQNIKPIIDIICKEISKSPPPSSRPQQAALPHYKDDGAKTKQKIDDIQRSKLLLQELEDGNDDEPISSILGDQDRSMSSQVQSIPTIDIECCIEEISEKPLILHTAVTPVVISNPLENNSFEGRQLKTDSAKEEQSDPTTKITALTVVTSDIDTRNEQVENVLSNPNPTHPKEETHSPMFRRNGANSHGKLINKIHTTNSHSSVNGQVSSNGYGGGDGDASLLRGVGLYNGNVKGAGMNHLTMSSSSSALAPDPSRIGHGKRHSNGVATVQVPVQAINRHVIGYGVNNNTNTNNNNNIYANSIEEDDRGSPASATSESRSADSDWQRSSTRNSFRGFCEGLLHDDEKITIQVPEVVEASISFDNEDNSSLDPDEERENSVEYISIADVKVNHERKSDRADVFAAGDDRDPLPTCVISLDIGSRGTGYSYWIKEEPDCVRIGNVDSGSSCPKSHKLPSWVSMDDLYLDVEDDDEDNTNNISGPGFGYQALDKFLSDDNQSQLFWKWRENFNEGSIYPYTLESKANDEELQLTMKFAIRHYARLALDQVALRKRGDPNGSTVIFLIAIPSNFDHRARQLVRDAAFGSGLVNQKDALALIEDPCAAGIFAYHAIKSRISKRNNLEFSYLSVDIGGVYLHSSGYEITEGKLHLILCPKSLPIVDSPESLFETELSAIFTPSFIFNYQNKYKAGWLKLMTEFESTKNMYDPLQRGNYHVFVPSSFVDHFRRFTSMEVDDALESSDILWSKVGALGIPYWKMQRFIQPMMEFIKDHILNLIKKHNYEILVLTGGRSGSRYMVDFIKNAVRDFSVDVAVPKEYNAAVLQGCTISLTNLAPRLIIKSPFSIGVGVMTPFIEDQHPEEKRVLRDGKSWCSDVWDSLIKFGQELELNRVILKRSYVGAQPGQSVLILPLFQSPNEPKFVTESSVQKCCEFKFDSGQRAWQEVELVIRCRPSELLITAVDGGVLKNVVVVDFSS